MKKFLLLLMLVLLTSCEGYQAVVYSYGVRQRPEPRPRRVYHYYTPYTYNPVVTPVYVYPSNYYYYPRHYNNRGGRRR
jgi:hypothetical protein